MSEFSCSTTEQEDGGGIETVSSWYLIEADKEREAVKCWRKKKGLEE